MLEKTNKATVISKESDKHKQKLQAEVAKLNTKIKVMTKCVIFHSVLERIWVKGSYLSQWLPQGERGSPKESKSRWIEILHGGSQFT